jgi:DNA-binding MarR family transcriptional regulator
LVSFLSTCAEADFKAIRDGLEMSDSALSQTMSALRDKGYVKVRKGYVGQRPRTWLALTADGRRKFSAHLAALQEIVEQAQRQGARHRQADVDHASPEDP